MEPTKSVWASRFLGATFVLGAVGGVVVLLLTIASVLTSPEQPNYSFGPAPSAVVSVGGPAEWFIIGLISYSILGILGLLLSGLYYQHIEVTMAKPITGRRHFAAWIHLVAGGMGSAAASLVIAYRGYAAGAALLPTDKGGGGQSYTVVQHVILSPLETPIGALVGVALFGYFVGGIALVSAWRAARKI